MRCFGIAALLCATALLAGCGKTDQHTENAALPALVGHYRVLASFADSSSRAKTLVNAFRSAPGLDQRDIAWFVVGPNGVVSSLADPRIPPRDNLEKLHTVNGFQTVFLDKNGHLLASQLGGLDIQALLDALNPLPSREQALSQ